MTNTKYQYRYRDMWDGDSDTVITTVVEDTTNYASNYGPMCEVWEEQVPSEWYDLGWYNEGETPAADAGTAYVEYNVTAARSNRQYGHYYLVTADGAVLVQPGSEFYLEDGSVLSGTWESFSTYDDLGEVYSGYIDGMYGDVWYLQSAVNENFWQYRITQKLVHIHIYGWGEWSEWSDSPVSESDRRQVQTRMLYKYLQ